MEKPRGFYITEGLNQRLNDAVRYFQEVHGIRKVDRSIVVSAMLEEEANWNETALDQLVERVRSQLTNRVTG
jgi:hypothetical protein